MKGKQPKPTPKQSLFCKEYIIDFNATRAAKAAGYKARSAYSIGIENLKKPVIQALLAVEMKKQEERIERTADEVITRLWKFSDIDEEKYDAEKSSNTKATELLAKHYKLITDKFEHEITLPLITFGKEEE